MVEGEDKKNKKDESKGFAGLSSLVSDVDTSPIPTSKKKPPNTSGVSSSPPPLASHAAQPQPRPQQPYQEHSQPSSESSSGKWVQGIAALIGVIWLIGQFNKPTTSPAPSQSPPARPHESTRPAESRPPVGQNTVLSTAQIRYCLAENIRMDGAEATVNNYINADVDRFNAMVTDYNSRCGSFRYWRGEMESARGDIEPYRNQLYAEGRQRFTYIIPQPDASESGNAHGQSNNNPSAQLNSSASSKAIRSDRERPRTHADLSTPNNPKCEYKAVMLNDDYLACGLKPPR